MTLRPYQDNDNWEQMRRILIEGRAADNGTYYVHVGDISWWLFYSESDTPFSEQIALWEDGGQVLGWVLFTPQERFFDLFVQPALRGTPQAADMHAWAEARLTEKVRSLGGADIRTMWIAETDSVRRQFLEARGFRPAGEADHSLHRMYATTRPLNEPIAEQKLPNGFAVRGCRGEVEVEARAAAQYGAFQSAWDWGRYVARFRRFMRSPVYRAEQDVVAVAPDGRIVAFAIHWLDTANQVGYFEPVGTHPDFQRRGLGRAVIAESLRRMQAAGMTQAAVCCEASDPTAVGFYLACGFQIEKALLMYVKDIG